MVIEKQVVVNEPGDKLRLKSPSDQQLQWNQDEMCSESFTPY